MELRAEYPNLLSRILSKRSFERQFAIPLEPVPVLLERLLQWYERNLLDVHTQEIEIDRPIFLIGVPRSGTTVLQDTLCAHPDVAYITNAMHNFRRCFCAVEDLRKRLNLDFRGERYLRDHIEVRPGTPNEGQVFLAEWHGIDPYSLDYTNLRPGDLSDQEMEAARETIRRVLWCFGGAGRRFFNKNPSLMPYTLLLVEIFADARIVHIVRDPRMVANSMLKLYQRHREQELWIRARLGRDRDDGPLFVPYPRLPKLAEHIRRFGIEDIRTTAHIWDDAITLLNEAKAQLAHFYELRYEDILADPRGEILKLCDFCELAAPEARGAAFWQKVGEIRDVQETGGYGSFEVIESICRSNMQRYGYL